MKALSTVLGLLLLSVPMLGADVTIHALITKRLTKKSLSPVVYNLRGAALPGNSPAPAENEFDRTVLILEGTGSTPKPPVTATLEQKDGRFEPDLIVIPAGSTVQFPNGDPVFHNVFSLSKAQPFDLGYYPQGQSRSVKFSHPGVVQVYCHIHSNMYAAIVVTASPWFGKPAADGAFTWSNIPAGHYKVTAWHKVAGMHRIEIDVPESGNVDASIRIPVDVEPRP